MRSGGTGMIGGGFGARGSRLLALAAVLTIALSLVVAGWVQAPTAARADVDDFEFESLRSEFVLGRDDEGRSTLRTTEHFVAVFPDFDQNRGFIRDIPRVYDGHETGVRVLSVTDENGAPRDFETEEYGDFLSVVMAVPEGSYVHGEQHYVIEYEQRDVTRYFEDTRADEFYWDVNGTEWMQPFGEVSATLTLEDGLADRLNGESACYRGKFRIDDPCDISRDGDGFSVSERDLESRENITVAVGFESDTFEPYPVPIWKRLPIFLYGAGGALVAAIGTVIVVRARGRKTNTGRAIIARYEPPEGLSVAVASELVGAGDRAMTASLLDFAVRGKARLLYDEQEDRYNLVAVDSTGLAAVENWIYARIFGPLSAASKVDPGTTTEFTEKSTLLGDTARMLPARAKAEVKRRGLLRAASTSAVIAVVLLLVAMFGLLFAHVVFTVGDGRLVLGTFTFIIGFVLLWLGVSLVRALAKPHRPSREGAELIEHLEGLREYIRLAEADRIRMLQSASGAEVDEQKIVQVYERLLPYAVIFGFEDEWQRELAAHYRESAPTWIESGDRPFATAFEVSRFRHQVSTAPVTRTSSSGGAGSSSGSFSSFSGGSSGGGFSGGGGGGGGGRGI